VQPAKPDSGEVRRGTETTLKREPETPGSRSRAWGVPARNAQRRFPVGPLGETVETFASGMIGGTDPPRNGRNIRAIRIKGGCVMFSVVSNMKTKEAQRLPHIAAR
jgi:hypothetical protein